MWGMPAWLRWISPWVALGLAAALAWVLLRPAPDAAAPLQAPPAADVREAAPRAGNERRRIA